MTEDVPAPVAAELEVRLTWHPAADGSLEGRLEVRNVGTRTVRVGGKPVVEPLGQDGQPLDTGFVVTAEFRMPPYVDLHPGQRAAAPVDWGGWGGPPASGRARVKVDGLSLDLDAHGPVQPANTDEPTNLSSSWFEPLAD